MPKILRLHHDEHFDLLAADDAPDTDSEGTYTVLNREGQAEERGKYRFRTPANTTDVELPDDYDAGDLTALTHLVQTLNDRHSDSVDGVSGTDPKLVSKVAALMGAEVREYEEAGA